MSTGGSGSQSIIVWEDPDEQRLRMYQAFLDSLVRRALHTPALSFPMRPVIIGCPAKKKVRLTLLYQYADGTPVPGAGYVLKDEDGKQLSANDAALGADGKVVLEVDDLDYYLYYFHNDAVTYTILEPLMQSVANPTRGLGAGCVDQLIAQNTLETRVLRFTPFRFVDQSDFVAFPSIGKILNWLLINNTPFVPHEATVRKQFLPVAADLLMELLPGGDDGQVWEALAFERLCCLSDDGQLLAALLKYLWENPKEEIRPAVELLNFHGKGNAVRWLKKCANRKLIDEIITNLTTICQQAIAEIQKISPLKGKGQTDKNAAFAAQAIILLTNFPVEARRQITSALTPYTTLLDGLAKQKLVYERNALTETNNVYRQKMRKLVPIGFLPRSTWLGVKYRYHDGITGVDGAEYVVREKNPRNADAAFHAEGPVDANGEARIDVPLGKEYIFFFQNDAKYKVDPGSKLAEPPAVPDPLVTATIANAHLLNAVLAWGAGDFTDQMDFNTAPCVRKIAHWALLKRRPFVMLPDDLAQILDLLYPLLMNPVKEEKFADGLALWRPLVLARVGACVGEAGTAAQAVLQYCVTNPAPDIQTAVNILNSFGKGNAVRFLKALAGAGFTNACVTDFVGVITDIQTALREIADAADVSVSPRNRSYASSVVEKIVDVLAVVERLVRESLDDSIKALKNLLKSHIVYERDACLVDFRSYQQQVAVALPRPVAAAPPFRWFDMEYRYADGSRVPNCELVLADGGGPKKPIKLAAGFRHFAIPLTQNFVSFNFCHEPELEIFPQFVCAANAAKRRLDLAGDLTRPLAAGRNKKVLVWGENAVDCADLQAYQENPSVAKLIFNQVRAATDFVIPGAAAESEVARLICFALMGDPTRMDWSAVAFLWLSTRRERDGYLLFLVLGFIYRFRKQQAVAANPPLADVVAIINSVAKGNAVRWLKSLQADANTFADDAANAFTALLKAIRADLHGLANPAGSDAVKDKIISAENRLFINSFFGNFNNRSTEDAGARAKACILEASTGLADLLVACQREPRIPPAMAYGTLNAIQQQRLPANHVNLGPPPWVAVRYCYHNGKAVSNARYVLTVAGGANPVSQDQVRGGIAFVPNPPTTGALTVHFRDEEASPGVAFKVLEAYESGTVPGTPLTATVEGVRAFAFDPFNGGTYRKFRWGDAVDARLVDENAKDFEKDPSIGKLAWWCTAKKSPRTTGGGNAWTDTDELTRLLRALLEGGTAGLTVVAEPFVNDNAEQDLVLWTAIALNRVGATKGVGEMKPEDSLVRKAVLEHIEFQIDLATLVVNNHAIEVRRLIPLLNRVGRGSSMKWLRLLRTQLNALRDDIRTNVDGILGALDTELNSFRGWYNFLTSSVRSYRERIAQVRAQIVPQINAVFQGFADKLDRLVPAATGTRPYEHTPLVMCQINDCLQPVAAFAECAQGHKVPVPWHRAPVAAIRVGYEHADGTPVPGVTFTLTGLNAPAAQALVNGRANFAVPNPAGDYNFTVEFDAPVVGIFDRAQPWANPYRVLDGANPVGNYLPLAAAARAVNELQWGDEPQIGNFAQFSNAPTLSRILADCVIDGCPLVSGANDVRDLTRQLAGLFQNPGWRGNGEEWFRLGVTLAGTIANTGGLQKGMMVFAYNGSLSNIHTAFSLVNWAGKLHGTHWLEQQIVARPFVATVQAQFIQILTRFDLCLQSLAAVGLPQVAQVVINNINTTVRPDIATLIAAAPNQFPTCFDRAVDRINTVLQNAPLPLHTPCGPGRTIYRQPQERDFLECGEPILAARKEALLTLADQRIDNGQVFRNVLPADTQTELTAFGVGTRGGQAKALAPQLAGMNDAEFRAEFTRLSILPGWNKVSDNILENQDGTLIRYKPNGDDYQRPPCPTYSVEVVKQNYIAPMNDPPLNRAAFKVDSRGRAVPKSPAEQRVGGNDAQEKAYYQDVVMKSGHKSLLF